MTSLHEDPRVLRGMERQLALRQRMLDDGARPVGWKLGLGTPAAMERLGTSAPLVGFLLDRGLLEEGSACGVGGWGRPVAEPEVAVHVGADVPARPDRETAAAAIAGLGAAIELADVGDSMDVEEVLAGDLFHRRFVLGAVREDAPGALRAAIRVNEADPKPVEDPYQLTGDPASAVAHVATQLAAVGEQLRAGDVIITGSIIPPIAVGPGDRLRYRLEPVGELALEIAE